MAVIAQLTLDALAQWGTPDLPGYAQALRDACAAHPPPFGTAHYGDTYRERASEPQWMAQSLIANAAKEGEGAAKLWQLAGRAPDPEVGELIRRHAVDEARHARFYLAILDLAFPDAVDDDLRDSLRDLSPGYSDHDHPPRAATPASEESVLDEIIQMNIGEIRTRIHQLLLRPVITAYCPACNQARLDRLMASLLDDETKHIDYTARLIQRAIENGQEPFVRDVMFQRMDEFNDITLREVYGEEVGVG